MTEHPGQCPICEHVYHLGQCNQLSGCSCVYSPPLEQPARRLLSWLMEDSRRYWAMRGANSNGIMTVNLVLTDHRHVVSEEMPTEDGVILIDRALLRWASKDWDYPTPAET